MSLNGFGHGFGPRQVPQSWRCLTCIVCEPIPVLSGSTNGSNRSRLSSLLPRR